VQLSLVAGAPQSFIQPLSQPLYTRRPEIPIATEAQLTPQTHEAASMVEWSNLRNCHRSVGCGDSRSNGYGNRGGNRIFHHEKDQFPRQIRHQVSAAGQFKVTVNMPGFQRYEQEGISVGDDDPR